MAPTQNTPDLIEKLRLALRADLQRLTDLPEGEAIAFEEMALLPLMASALDEGRLELLDRIPSELGADEQEMAQPLLEALIDTLALDGSDLGGEGTLIPFFLTLMLKPGGDAEALRALELSTLGELLRKECGLSEQARFCFEPHLYGSAVLHGAEPAERRAHLRWAQKALRQDAGGPPAWRQPMTALVEDLSHEASHETRLLLGYAWVPAGESLSGWPHAPELMGEQDVDEAATVRLMEICERLSARLQSQGGLCVLFDWAGAAAAEQELWAHVLSNRVALVLSSVQQRRGGPLDVSVWVQPAGEHTLCRLSLQQGAERLFDYDFAVRGAPSIEAVWTLVKTILGGL